MVAVSDVLAAVLAVMFFAAAITKARAQSHSTAPVLPGVRWPALVWVIVAVEFANGVAFLTQPRLGAILGGVLLVAFTIALVVLHRRYPSEPCRCFGELSQRPIGVGHYLRNLGMLAGCSWILLA
ncbi:MAG: MauE/DoxX family redox-associated membrane protein [Acidimicrobiia bacterium]